MLIGTTDFCLDDLEKEIRVDIYRSAADGNHKLLGSIDGLTLDHLKDTVEPEFEFTIP